MSRWAIQKQGRVVELSSSVSLAALHNQIGIHRVSVLAEFGNFHEEVFLLPRHAHCAPNTGAETRQAIFETMACGPSGFQSKKQCFKGKKRTELTWKTLLQMAEWPY